MARHARADPRVFHQQVVPVEIDALGDITALTSTNALTLTIGSF
jgi:hypothetical protein